MLKVPPQIFKMPVPPGLPPRVKKFCSVKVAVPDRKFMVAVTPELGLTPNLGVLLKLLPEPGLSSSVPEERLKAPVPVRPAPLVKVRVWPLAPTVSVKVLTLMELVHRISPALGLIA